MGWVIAKTLETKIIFTNGKSFCACPLKDGAIDWDRVDRRIPKGVLHKYEANAFRTLN